MARSAPIPFQWPRGSARGALGHRALEEYLLDAEGDPALENLRAFSQRYPGQNPEEVRRQQVFVLARPAREVGEDAIVETLGALVALGLQVFGEAATFRDRPAWLILLAGSEVNLEQAVACARAQASQF